ncbi:MAG: 3-deoxy-manno-octulosonate cytidylyltransferase [Verrucomicrobiota bacterium]|jgi:3-deoxy-manno-octulosonate cytidylyltransferase (CMP-KDO synthetase)|nr:3-deoxy-manno-octulosonate cytidylyltransferase [Verrucomicrobiota bacterium]
MSKRIVGVIPARWGSTRFPGKSLAPIAGKPLLEWVVERVLRADRLAGVWVATDDERIAMVACRSGASVAMTCEDHPSGTDRVAEAVGSLHADGVVNIQGDEPLIDPDLINQVAAMLADAPEWDMVTACTPLHTAAELHSPDVVKVVRAANGAALYFSRAPIPFIRGEGEAFAPQAGCHMRHIGIYGYQRSFLERLVREPPCLLESMEKLEQLRALYIGARMYVLEGTDPGGGVDTPEDVARVEALLGRSRRD